MIIRAGRKLSKNFQSAMLEIEFEKPNDVPFSHALAFADFVIEVRFVKACTQSQRDKYAWLYKRLMGEKIEDFFEAYQVKVINDGPTQLTGEIVDE